MGFFSFLTRRKRSKNASKRRSAPQDDPTHEQFTNDYQSTITTEDIVFDREVRFDDDEPMDLSDSELPPDIQQQILTFLGKRQGTGTLGPGQGTGPDSKDARLNSNGIHSDGTTEVANFIHKKKIRINGKEIEDLSDSGLPPDVQRQIKEELASLQSRLREQHHAMEGKEILDIDDEEGFQRYKEFKDARKTDSSRYSHTETHTINRKIVNGKLVEETETENEHDSMDCPDCGSAADYCVADDDFWCGECGSFVSKMLPENSDISEEAEFMYV